MPYPKNVPNLERAIRIVIGLAIVGLAFFGQSLFGEPTPLRMGLALFTAAFVIITGFVGWCPACALVGRKLKSKSKVQ